MELTAFFEIWHLADGNYPPIHKGQLVNLSFQLFPTSLEKLNSGDPEHLEHLGDALYRFAGRVLKNYGDEEYPFIVVQTQGFRFYIKDALAKGFEAGDLLAGEGSLGLDTYYWVEYLDSYNDPPDLFYNLEVKRIRKIYDLQSPRYLAAPPEKDSEEINDMDAQDEVGNSILVGATHCAIDFDSQGQEGKSIPRTFI